MPRFLILLLSTAVAALAQLTDQRLAILGATVVDGTGASPRQATVLLRGERIEAVGADLVPPAGVRILRAEGHTLIPGLFDLHTHLPYSAVGGLSGDWGKNLAAYLLCGVTSVVDFGTYPETFEPMRRLVASGAVAGPRIHLAARVTTPGGHGAEGGRGRVFSLEVLTPREARAAMARILPYRPDAIKVFTDGWRYGTAPDMTSMEEETLAAIVEEAHRHGIEVLTHTVTLEKAKIAARAGVDVIAHGVGNAPADEELIRLMRARGTVYAPTLAVYEPRDRSVVAESLRALLDPAALKLIRPQPARSGAPAEGPRMERWKLLQRNTAALRAAGVPFGTGTDAGVTGTYHGWSTLRELELLVEGGLSPLEAITAATGASARALKVDAERGVIAAGKLADLVLIEGAPHAKIADIVRIRRVFLGGREIDREALARRIASEAVTPLAPRRLPALVDDMEKPDRTSLGTLRVNGTDSGHDHSQMIFGRTRRAAGGHALSIHAWMAEKNRPLVRLDLPLTPGAVEPADARGFSGVRFEARGDGAYRLVVPTRGVRDSAFHAAPFRTRAAWTTVSIAFASLSRADAAGAVPWTGSDLLMLSFELARDAGAFAWLELDNVRLYK